MIISNKKTTIAVLAVIFALIALAAIDGNPLSLIDIIDEPTCEWSVVEAGGQTFDDIADFREYALGPEGVTEEEFEAFLEKTEFQVVDGKLQARDDLYCQQRGDIDQ